jgi:hypothetical protein
MSEKKFSIARSERRTEAASADVESFVAGTEPETTKTFRIPVRLSRELRIHAAKTGQTEKEILTRLISEYLESKQ